MKNNSKKTSVVLIAVLCLIGMAWAQTGQSAEEQQSIISLTKENTVITLFVPIISFLGVIISAIVSFVISKGSRNVESMKIHYEFKKELNSKRLEAYLEIYNLVSGFIKKMERKGISDKDLNVFYEEYSILDSKSALLFEKDTAAAARKLMKKIGLVNQNIGTIDDNLNKELIKMSREVENSMKIELKALKKEP
jgi:5-bromo-4-chloroindolyl phosphate hydrolysis protein